MKRKKLNSDEVKKIELQLLLKFDELCKKHDLQYSLCGGTLLGAIRHKGFIPWDDDIDVMMPRDDFEKLLKLEKTQASDQVEKLVSWKSGKSIYPFIKMINTKTVLKEKYLDKEYTTGVWIDIFPIDGMPEDQKIVDKKYKKVIFYKMMLMTAYSEMGKGTTWYAALAKRFLIPICRHLNTKKICNKMNKISKEYPVSKSPYAGIILWGYGPQEKMPRKEFLEYVEVEFEGHKFPGPKCWDFYLSQLYGDYMKLPPEDKRVFHDFDAWIELEDAN